MRGFPHGVAKANYTLGIDAENCAGCGLCAKACNVGALEAVARETDSKKKVMMVDAEKCLGCGACISACKTESLSLVPAARPEPPEKKRDLFARILKEKKRLRPFVVEGVKKKILRSIGLG